MTATINALLREDNQKRDQNILLLCPNQDIINKRAYEIQDRLEAQGSSCAVFGTIIIPGSDESQESLFYNGDNCCILTANNNRIVLMTPENYDGFRKAQESMVL